MYNEQKAINIQAFVYNEEVYRQKYECLRSLAIAFKKEGVKWGLCCSSALFFNGIVDDFHDYDIMIAESDSEKAVKVLKAIAIEEEPIFKSCFYSSRYYGEFALNGVDIDVMCPFGVYTFGTQYTYSYNYEQATIVTIDDFEVPLVPEEAQMILYAMMEGWQPQRKFKRELIVQYLKAMGVKHKDVFEDALRQRIPYWLKAEIKRLYP